MQEIIPPELGEELERSGLDINDPQISRAVEIVLNNSYSGPMMLPPAFVLEEYKRELPEIVPKLVEWTGRQITHRHNLEEKVSDASERRKDRSQLGAAAVAIVGIVCETVVAVSGATVAAIVIAIVAVGGPVAAYTLANRFNIGGDSKP